MSIDLEKKVLDCTLDKRLISFCDIIEYRQPKICAFLGKSREVSEGENGIRSVRKYECLLHLYDPQV